MESNKANTVSVTPKGELITIAENSSAFAMSILNMFTPSNGSVVSGRVPTISVGREARKILRCSWKGYGIVGDYGCCIDRHDYS